MNAKSRLLVLPAILAMTVGSLFADPKPAMVVQVVQTDDPDAYAAMITKMNAVIKAKTGVERLRQVWVGDLAGDQSHEVFAVSVYPSAAVEGQIMEKLANDPDVKVLLAQMKSLRHLGASVLYKAVRNEGAYEGGAVFNTSITCTDEDAYVKALDDLKAIFDANGFKDVKVNLWRVAAGRGASTHLVVLALPSQARVGEFIDAIWDQALLKDWNVGAAKIRTTVHNGTYHEITK
jgi:uncharacterized protein YbaA (DUF1428 family)